MHYYQLSKKYNVATLSRNIIRLSCESKRKDLHKIINLEFGFTCVCLVITFLHSNPQPRVLQIQDNKFTERLMLVVLD